jgi:hypothetical protein
VSEAGGDTFTVVVTSEPTFNVLITVVSGDAGEATVDTATLTITPANVTDLDDGVDDDDQTASSCWFNFAT